MVHFVVRKITIPNVTQNRQFRIQTFCVCNVSLWKFNTQVGTVIWEILNSTQIRWDNTIWWVEAKYVPSAHKFRFIIHMVAMYCLCPYYFSIYSATIYMFSFSQPSLPPHSQLIILLSYFIEKRSKKKIVFFVLSTNAPTYPDLSPHSTLFCY